MLVTITYLQPRSWRAAWTVFRLSSELARGATSTPGFVAGRLRIDRRLHFWTLTGWHDRGAMSSFTQGPPHAAAMARVEELTRVARFATLAVPDDRLPGWPAAHEALRAQAPQLAAWTPAALVRPMHPGRRVSADELGGLPRLPRRARS